MRNIKAAQLADQIRDYLAAWTARDYPGSFVVVTDVTLNPKLTTARVWVRINKNEGVIFQKLLKATKHYQQKLVVTLPRFRVPFIMFALDTSAADPLDSLPNQ